MVAARRSPAPPVPPARRRIRRHVVALLAVVTSVGLLLLFRALVVEPRAWGTACVGAAPPLLCAPRAALLWLQQWQLWGLGGLALGLAGFIFARFWLAVLAVAVGAMAVANYNASWGMLGAFLGAWAWLRVPACPAGPRA